MQPIYSSVQSQSRASLTNRSSLALLLPRHTGASCLSVCSPHSHMHLIQKPDAGARLQEPISRCPTCPALSALAIASVLPPLEVLTSLWPKNRQPPIRIDIDAICAPPAGTRGTRRYPWDRRADSLTHCRALFQSFPRFGLGPVSQHVVGVILLDAIWL